jgi:hypothetical protein
MAAGWTQIRDMPAPAKKTFHQMWRKRAKVDWRAGEEPAPH